MTLRRILGFISGLASFRIAYSNTCWSRSATLPFNLNGAACSTDGSDIILATPGNSLYFSFTFGSGFAQVSSLADWQGVAISSNGKFAAAVANGDSNVYVLSTNPQHQTPIPVRAPGLPGFTTVAIPAGTTNGFPLFVAQGTHSGLIYEVDSSSSVTARPGQSQQHWVGIAVSADGHKGYAAGGGPDLEYIFRFEGGGSWVQAFGPNNWTGGVPHVLLSFCMTFCSDRQLCGRFARDCECRGRFHLRVQGLRRELGSRLQQEGYLGLSFILGGRVGAGGY